MCCEGRNLEDLLYVKDLSEVLTFKKLSPEDKKMPAMPKEGVLERINSKNRGPEMGKPWQGCYGGEQPGQVGQWWGERAGVKNGPGRSRAWTAVVRTLLCLDTVLLSLCF